MNTRETMDVIVPLTFTYNYRVGQYLQRYMDGLKEQKILGIRCPSCGKVRVPPRSTCGPCNRKMEEWVEVGPAGVVENFTLAHVAIEDGEVRRLAAPSALAMIRLDGADSLVTARVEKLDPASLRAGLRVKAVWKEERTGSVKDLDHFEPAGE